MLSSTNNESISLQELYEKASPVPLLAGLWTATTPTVEFENVVSIWPANTRAGDKASPVALIAPQKLFDSRDKANLLLIIHTTKHFLKLVNVIERCHVGKLEPQHSEVGAILRKVKSIDIKLLNET